MPAALSHYLHAVKVFESLQGRCGALSQEKDAFLWGAQGPDFMFAHRFFPWQKGESLAEYGVRLHRDSSVRTLEFMRDCTKNAADNPVLLSYVLGFLCHYALDSSAHPFVNYGAGLLHEQIKPSSLETCHHTIEAALDVILLRYERGELPTAVGLKTTVPKNERVRTAMVGLYQALLEHLYSKLDCGRLLEQAIDDCRTAFGLMTDRTTLKRQLAEYIEKKRKIPPVISCHVRPISEGDEFDYANILHAQWQDTANEVRTESFLELYEQAAVYAEALIHGFLDGDDIRSLTKDAPF